MNESEEFRHECEVRYVVNLQSDAARATYLAGVAIKRGQSAAQSLRMDAMKVIRGKADSAAA